MSSKKFLLSSSWLNVQAINWNFCKFWVVHQANSCGSYKLNTGEKKRIKREKVFVCYVWKSDNAAWKVKLRRERDDFCFSCRFHAKQFFPFSFFSQFSLNLLSTAPSKFLPCFRFTSLERLSLASCLTMRHLKVFEGWKLKVILFCVKFSERK